MLRHWLERVIEFFLWSRQSPEQLELHCKKGSKDKVVKREVCAVVTKGTLTEGEMMSANPEASYLMAVTESCQISANQQERVFGVCVVGAATSNTILGQFRDDPDCSALCYLLSELRPVEFVKPARLQNCLALRALLRHTRSPLVNELVLVSELWDAEKTVCEIKAIYRRINEQSVSSSLNEANLHAIESSLEDGFNSLPGVLSGLANAGNDGSYALSALGGTLFYLKQAFLEKLCLDLQSLSCFHALVSVILLISHTCFLMQLHWRTLRYLRTAEMEALQEHYMHN